MKEASMVEERAAGPPGEDAAATERSRPPAQRGHEPPPRTGASPYLVGLFLIGLFIVLYFARAVFLPLVLALFLAFLLQPLVRLLAKVSIPASVGAGAVIGASLFVIIISAAHLVEPASRWIDEAPTMLERVNHKLGFLRKPLEDISEAGEEVRKATGVNETSLAVPVKLSSPPLTDSVLSTTGSFLSSFLVTVILLYFLLSSGDRWLQKAVEMTPRIGDRTKVIDLARTVQTGISGYLLSTTLINCCLGVCVGTGLWLAGMPNPFLWGALAAALNFIPYLGAIAGVTVVGLVALVSFDEPGRALLAAGVYGALTVVEGNLITPIILGRRLDLNPMFIFISLVFWGWLWGVAGALLAVPILASFKLSCDHIERLKPVATLLTK